MNPTCKSSFPAVLDPVVAAVMEQLEEQVEAKERVIAEKDRALAAAEAIIQQLKEALRLERIKKYGKQSEKLSDLQLELLDLEPSVSSDEIKAEIASGPLPEQEKAGEAAPRRQNKPHPGRNGLPSHLERIEEIVVCAASQCKCGKCGRETQVIGYDETEVLGMKPAVHFVRVIKREKRACTRCAEHGVVTAPAPARIAPKSIFADETIIDFIVRKYCDALPLYRQRAILMRDLGIDVALTTIDDAVLRVGELLIPVVETMKRDLLAGSYIQADETYVGVQTPERKGANHRAFFWQYSAPAKGVVFDFEMTVFVRATTWLTGSDRRGRLLCDFVGVGGGRKAIQLVDGAIGEPGQRVGQVFADGDAEFAAALHNAEDSGDLWAGLFASQVQPVFSSNRNRPHRVLGPVSR